ncbi:unnamed protein product [Porites lobata]|uniref:Uncharacterized protein n=1 Tax=Porites lobata TaxID=104759 RepID=A0ABN8MRW8_9CNID|nr:unnamed protein product [Porites lobata]
MPWPAQWPSVEADIFAITETWFTEIDSAHRVDVTPPTYKLYDHARSGLNWEWDCLTLCRDNLGVTKNFADYLESIILSLESLLVTGDIDIHVDVVGDPDRAKFLELNETVGLQQDVITPTCESGHTLDLIISRQCENLVKTTPVSDYHISDP